MTDRQPPTTDGDDLAWLGDALFVDPDAAAFRPARGRRSRSHLAFPSTAVCRRIVPSDRTMGAGAFAKQHDGMSRRRLLAGRATAAAIRLGGSNLRAGNALSLPPSFDVGGDPARSLLAVLGRQWPETRGAAITLGPRRTNRKPIVQLLDEMGTTIAFAKVACNDITASLVTNELSWLQRAARSDHDSLAAPAVIAELVWKEHPVIVLEAIGVREHTPAALTPQRCAQLHEAIAALGPVRETTVGDLCSSVLESAEASIVDLANLVVEALGDRPIVAGAWHGDLTPWNTISEPDRTWVLDWEFADDDMPIGADLIHRDAMVATHLNGVDPSQALRDVSNNHPAELVALYLLKLVDRDATLRQFGLAADPLALAARPELRRVLSL